jgi:hypothetical protein
LRQGLRGQPHRRPPELHPGLPAGLDPSTLDAVTRRWQDCPPGEVRYQHLSGWKDSGAYRVHVSLPDGRAWRLIFKEAYYGAEQIPALRGFPGAPGAAEYAVYSQAEGALSGYLPQVYQAEAVADGCHYRYLLEDLSEGWGIVTGGKGVRALLPALPDLHRALREWGATADLGGFVGYDAEFSAGLRRYALDSLTAYAERGPGDRSPVSAFLRGWDAIARAHAGPGFDLAEDAQPIHGDLNLRNVLFNRGGNGAARLLDWEWAGVGRPYADLAALVKHLPAEVSDEALTRYAALRPERPLAEHRRRFAWELLDRGLWDAAFMASQILLSPPKTSMNVQGFLSASLRQAQQSAVVLAGRSNGTLAPDRTIYR